VSRRLSFRPVALLLLAGLLLAACDLDGSTGPTPTQGLAAPTATPVPAGRAGAPAPGATSPPTASALKPAGQKVLRFPQGADPQTTDPQLMSDFNEVAWGQLAFEALLELNEQQEPAPGAAERMDVSADRLQYTLTLRQGLRYSDGVPLTAHNYEYAFRRLLDPALPGRAYASSAYDIRGAQELSEFTALTDTVRLRGLQDALGVHATDDLHIVFTLRAPVAYFPYVLALWAGWPVREDMAQAGGASWTEPATYVGNGPFILRAWNHGSGAVWEANPNYRKGRPKIDRLEIHFIPESAVAFRSFQQGELDWVGIAPEDLTTIQQDPTLRQELAPLAGSCTTYLGFNVRKPPFDNLAVRRAFAQALDRQDYVSAVLKNLAQPADSFIPPGHPGYAPDIHQAPFDAAAARRLLDGAVRDAYPQGLPPVTLTFRADPRAQQRMEWLQAQWKANLGLDLALQPVEARAYTALLHQPASLPQIFFYAWCQDYPDPQDWLSLVFRSDATYMQTGWSDARVDDLTRRADVEPDPARRLQLYTEAQQIIVDETPVVFLYWTSDDLLISARVHGLREHRRPGEWGVPGFSNIANIDVDP
jgi:oligopeptide transport system substrate-binding protein